jgi:hypothetical protein
MQARHTAFLLCILLVIALQVHAQKQQDGCGDNKVSFKIRADKNQPEPAPPAAGMAQIVLIERLDKCSGCGAPSIRFGMDGAWVGANKGNSYFTLDVAPGEHLFCAALQSDASEAIRRLGPARLVAEAGNTYYFEVKVTPHHNKTANGADEEMPIAALGPQSHPGGAGNLPAGGQSDFEAAVPDLHFALVGDEEGKALVKASAHSTFQSRR